MGKEKEVGKVVAAIVLGGLMGGFPRSGCCLRCYSSHGLAVKIASETMQNN